MSESVRFLTTRTVLVTNYKISVVNIVKIKFTK